MKHNSRKHFTAADFHPQHGEPMPLVGRVIFEEMAEKSAVFNTIFISNPRHTPAFAALDKCRFLGLAEPGLRKRALRILGPSASGKTTVIKAYERKVREELPIEERERRRPVVIIPLNADLTIRSFWVKVLSCFGDTMIRKSDTEENLRPRAYEYIRKYNVELLIIDEVQHLESGTTKRVDVTDRLKSFLDDCIVPLAMTGTMKALPMLRRNIQLANRMIEPADITPLTSKHPQDVKDFSGFLKRLDAAIVKKGLMACQAGLSEDLVAACIMEVSKGVIGRAVNLVRVAFERAVCRKSDRIELCDLQAAVTNWAVTQRVAVRNPFQARKGD